MSNAETFAWLESQKSGEQNEFRAMSGGSRVSTAKVWNGKILMVHPRIQKGAKRALHDPFDTVFDWLHQVEEGHAVTGVWFTGTDVKTESQFDQVVPLVITTEPPSAATIAGATEVPPAAPTTAIAYDPVAEASAVENSLQRLPDIFALHGHQERMMTELNRRLGSRRASAFVPVSASATPYRSVTPPPHPPRAAPPPLPSRTRPSNQREERIEGLISALTNSLREIAMTD